MTEERPSTNSSMPRRSFVALAAAGSAAVLSQTSQGSVASLARQAATAGARGGDDLIRVGVIGCGGRGTGAAVNAMQASDSVRVVAMADLFEDRLSGSAARLRDHELSGQVSLDEDRLYHGFDAYRRLLNESADLTYVILATPPGFRPLHFQAAINSGKHVFMEKPVAVDPAGVRRVLAASERADEQRLCVATGTQRRHQQHYLEAMQRVRDGAIGEVINASCYWNQGGLWVHERKPEYSDTEWQCRNWLYFCWLSGDHICEQHIHNIDVVNWAMDATPTKAIATGGRQVRTAEKYGNIFDHFAVELHYPGERRALSMCRQIDGTPSRVEEFVRGTRGTMLTSHNAATITPMSGDTWKMNNQNNPYVQEHVDLIAAITGEKPRLNEAKRTAESTMTAILGRMAAYTGEELTWDAALASGLDLVPTDLDFGPLSVRPVPTPGRG